MDPSRILITGANGQLGKALQAQYPQARALGSDELDITNQAAVESYDWSTVEVIINAAAYTNVDGAETDEGKETAHKVNTDGVRNLAKVAKEHNLTLVHISTDYVFDGSHTEHIEDETFSPLSVYGQSKADGDMAASNAPKHYIIRSSWVIGDGKNFVRTMLEVGKKGVNPSVVSDQIGRLTFTTELAKAIDHLLTTNAPYGTYNVSNGGTPASWADITREIYRIAQLPNTVTNITTAEYFADKPEAAKRPLQSTLSLDKITAAGFTPTDWKTDLQSYVTKELAS